jgi:hypothetical protein
MLRSLVLAALIFAGVAGEGEAQPVFPYTQDPATGAVTFRFPVNLGPGPTIINALQLGTFAPELVPGNQTGTSPWLGWLFERTKGQCSTDFGGLFPSSNVEALECVSELSAASTDPAGSVAGLGTRAALAIDVKTTDTILNSVALQGINLSYNTGAKSYGIDLIVGNNNSGVTAAQVTGLEVDLQGTGPVTFEEGLEIQAFNSVTANVGGRFTASGGTPGTFGIGWDYSGATYTVAAENFANNTVAQRWLGTASQHTTAKMDSSNIFHLANAANKIQLDSSQVAINGPNLSGFTTTVHLTTNLNYGIENASGTVTLVAINDAGNTYEPVGMFASAYTFNNAGVAIIGTEPTVGAGAVGYGSTVTANTSCGTLATSAGCLKINVAGTAHFVPYY